MGRGRFRAPRALGLAALIETAPKRAAEERVLVADRLVDAALRQAHSLHQVGQRGGLVAAQLAGADRRARRLVDVELARSRHALVF
jgi:hypothetical protein